MRFDDDCFPQSTNGIPDVTTIALEVTRKCCLRCDYCYMDGYDPVTLSTEAADGTVDWLLRNSGDQKRVKIHFFGGEPLMATDIIERIVKYGRKRAEDTGKSLSFAMTTNLVLADKERIAWAKQLGVGFHTSIDGSPAAHDKHRVFRNGNGSSDIVAKNAKHVLAEHPNITARATVSPDTCQYLFESVQFLTELGYRKLAFIPVPELDWSDEVLETYDAEMGEVTDYFVERYRNGQSLWFHALSNGIRSIVNPRPPEQHCGAGRHYLGVDVQGTVWPCHRFSGYPVPPEEIALGTVFEGGLSNSEARQQFLDFRRVRDMKADCASCPALHACGTMCVAVSYNVHRELGRTVGRYCDLRRIEFKRANWAHYVLRKEENKAFLKEFYPRKRSADPQRARGVPRVARATCPSRYSGTASGIRP